MSVGPWRYDATPVVAGQPSGGTRRWESEGQRTSGSPTGLAQAAYSDAIAGAGTTNLQAAISSAVSTSLTGPLPPDSHYVGQGNWAVPYTWGAQAAVESLALSESYLPADVYDQDAGTYVNPNVTGVEWGFPEPTGNATMAPSITFGDYDNPAQTWRVMFRVEPDNDGPLPAYLTRSDLLATFATIGDPLTTADVDAKGADPYYTVPAWDVGAALAGFNRYAGQRLTFAIVDKDHTIDGAAPADNSNQALTLLDYGLRQEYRVPYRLLMTGAPKPLRQFPRNDGLAGSARRLHPAPRSRQRSNRRAGGYL